MDVTAKIYEEEVAQIGQATDYCCQEDGVLVAFPNEKCRNKGCEAGPEEVESVLPDYGTCRCGVVGLKDVGDLPRRLCRRWKRRYLLRE